MVCQMHATVLRVGVEGMDESEDENEEDDLEPTCMASCSGGVLTFLAISARTLLTA
ncbi:hypothetical protein DPMN_108121 [Dreissena polymorpha]|uniref:Uncharacterized protein n=1 Tax=Dreissena polymorpha TaxID=45954 RepID=A0A9D4K858_DREPO|nr:hypothetical protein DPMN_108121 [Dreissena polymorpha]